MADALSDAEARRIARRSYMVQTLLNFRTMQGPGNLYSLLPLLPRTGDTAGAVRRAAGFMNSHPVFAAYAQGAMLRRLRTGAPVADAEYNAWRESLAGPLGLVGDQLIWDRWKPLVFAAGILPVLLWPSLTTWMITALFALLLYNVPLFRLRVYGARRGYERGEHVLEALGDPWIPRARRALNRAGVVVAALVLGLAPVTAAGGEWRPVLQFGLAFAVMLGGQRLRLPPATALLFALTAALGLGSVM